MGVKHILHNPKRNVLPFPGLNYAAFIIQSRYKKPVRCNAETLTLVELFDNFKCF